MKEIFDNIRKLYQFYVPNNELAEYIEFFSESSAEETYRQVADNPFTVTMFPSWTPTAYINLGQPYQLAVGTRQFLIDSNSDILILRNTIVERHNLPTDRIVTIKFYPGGLEAILGLSQPQFADRVVKLETIVPTALLQRVKQATCFTERVAILEQYLLTELRHRSTATHYRTIVADTIGTFEASGLILSPGQLADRMFATSKTINRYFHRVVGTSPKQYLSVVRTRAALSGYVANRKQFAPDLYGYYDLSHFYKDVLRFTGQKVGEHMDR